MSEPFSIGLSKLFLWPDPSRIQTWPRLLAAMDPNEEFRTLADIARKYLSSHETSRRHVGEVEVVRGWPGIEKRDEGRIVLNGVGLLDRVDGRLHLSELALQLRRAYLDDPDGKAWVRILARTIAYREPRTRCLLRLLSTPETYLVFSGEDWFEGSNAKARFYFPEGDPVYPLIDPREEGNSPRTLRTVLNEMSWWALGEWREHGYLIDSKSCVLEGVKGGPFSLDSISTKIRASFELFGYLGVIRHHGSETWLDQDSAVAELGIDLASDFGWCASGFSAPSSPIEILQSVLDEVAMETGFVVASQLRDFLHERGIRNPDKEIGELIRSGQLRLEGEEHGQSRHGEGLFGDPGKQLVKFRILSSK